MSRCFPLIPEFVEPYPDENCYSILCRCYARSALSASRFRQIMFGNKRFMSCYLWQPFRVEDLTRWFGEAESRANLYMLRHSCIPYRYPFLIQMVREDYECWAAGEEFATGTYQRQTLKLGCRSWTKQYFYYCPECVENDRRNYGETYWHMIPQLPGVYVCPVHAVPLEPSALMMSNSWIDLVPAEYCLPDLKPRKETISYDDLCLATDTQWMMENGWEIEIQLGHLVEGLSSWQFEQVEAKVNRFTKKNVVKNETAYYILLANMKGRSISEFVMRRENAKQNNSKNHYGFLM